MKKEYESPAVQAVPLVMESAICETSTGVLETIVITDPYAGDDLG